MKSILFFLIVNLGLVNASLSQCNGVYLSEGDFTANEITSLDKSDSLIILVEGFHGTVTLSNNGEVKKFEFGTIYGYCEGGIKYRAYGSKRKFFPTSGFCKVLDESGLTIYSKPSRHHRSTGYIWHYYSKSPTSEIRLLTLKNIKKDFPDNPEFVDVMSRSMKRKDYLREANGRLMINEIYFKTANKLNWEQSMLTY